MTESEIYAFLTGVFHDLFLRDDIILSAATSAADVEGWDSFKQIEIILATQEAFDIKLTTKEMDHLTSVGDLVALIAAKT